MLSITWCIFKFYSTFLASPHWLLFKTSTPIVPNFPMLLLEGAWLVPDNLNAADAGINIPTLCTRAKNIIFSSNIGYNFFFFLFCSSPETRKLTPSFRHNVHLVWQMSPAEHSTSSSIYLFTLGNMKNEGLCVGFAMIFFSLLLLKCKCFPQQ